jgi:hypothetical protein
MPTVKVTDSFSLTDKSLTFRKIKILKLFSYVRYICSLTSYKLRYLLWFVITFQPDFKYTGL